MSECTPLKEMNPAMLVFELSGQTQAIFAAGSERSQIMSAAMMATHLHRRQTRMIRGGVPRVPYIEHPLRVALRLIRWGVTDSSTIVAALLHDTVEDCTDEILTYFAGMSKSFVAELTEAMKRTLALRWVGVTYGEAVKTAVAQVTNPLAEENISYLEHLTRIDDPRALLIKASDLADNAGSLPHQYGLVKQSFITKRVAKYSAVIPVMINALQTAAARTTSDADHAVIEIAINKLWTISQRLVALELLIDQD